MILFENAEQRELALRKHKHHIGTLLLRALFLDCQDSEHIVANEVSFICTSNSNTCLQNDFWMRPKVRWVEFYQALEQKQSHE